MRAFLKKVNIYAPTRHRIYYLEFLFNHHLPMFTTTYLIRKLVYNQCNQSESSAVVI